MSAKPNVDDFTVPEKILVAADHLEKQGQSPFTAEMLIVSSWQKFPSTFGLKGFTEKYPDSNKILSSIMGEKGLARRGWLVKMGQKLYAMTREGRNVVRRVMLQEEEPPPAGTTQRLNRDHDRFMKVLFDSSAVQKFEDNRKHELTFADASRFWGITENMKGDQIEARLDEMDKTLAELDRVLADVDGEDLGRAARDCGRRSRNDQHPPLHGGPLRKTSQPAANARPIDSLRLRLAFAHRPANAKRKSLHAASATSVKRNFDPAT